MHVLFLVTTAIFGVVVGGALDGPGQVLADASQRQEAERRAARVTEGAPAPQQVDEQLVHLLPAGHSPRRRAGAGVVTGALFALAAWRIGAHLVLLPILVFFATLVMISVTDLTHRLVPRQILYVALGVLTPLIVIVAVVDHDVRSLEGAAVGGVVAFLLFFALWWFVPKGIGFGDVRLAGLIGLVVGSLSLLHVYVAFLVGFVVGMLFGLALTIGSTTGRKTRIPFAPSLALGAVYSVLWGGALIHALFPAAS